MALLAAAAGIAVRLCLYPALGDHSPYLPAWLAVIAAARFGGVGPGFAATALGGAGILYFFVEPVYSFRVEDPNALAAWGLFTLTGGLVSLLAGRLHDAVVAAAHTAERLRMAQSAAGEGVWDWNPQTGRLDCTPEFDRLYGVLPGSLKTRDGWHRLLHPEDAPRVEAEHASALARGSVCETGFRIVRGTGEVRWLSAKCQVFRDARGAAVRVLGVHMDVTARHQLESTLRRQAELIDLCHDAIVVTGPDRRIETWNQGAAEIYGWPESEAVGQPLPELLRTRGPVPLAGIDEVLAREGRWDGQLFHTARDGREVIVESRQIRLPAAGDVPAGRLEISRDITERYRAEAAFQRISEQHAVAMEAANLGAWNYRPVTGEMFLDDRCLAMFGFSPGYRANIDSLIARVHPDDRTAFRAEVRQAIAGSNGGVYRHCYRIVWPDGSIHWVLSRGRALQEEAGGQLSSRFAGVCVDVTALRQSEDRVQQTQKLESVGVLAAGIAHDFNNILTVIMGGASGALSECPACEYARPVLAAAERAAHLTRQLLAYSGQGYLETKRIDLSDLVSSSAPLLSASLPKRTRMALDLAFGLPAIECDPNRIEQLLLSLVVNAGEAIPAWTDGRVDIATRAVEVTAEMARCHAGACDVNPGAFVCLSVQDNGSGMDEATVPHIFEPYFSTKFTGRGLGLAAVQGIVRTSKGFIDLETVPGRGATFRIYLPASSTRVRGEPAPDRPAEHRQGASTVLVVDDEELVRRLAVLALNRRGYEVLTAADGQEALQVLAKTARLPALAVVDLAMPVMGGDELVPLLEAKYPRLPVVVSSGYPEEEARGVFRSGTVAGFLQKPYTGTVLAEKIQEALGRGIAGQGTGSASGGKASA